MSVSASIDIKLENKNMKKINSIEIIKRLIEFGWTLNDNGKVSYLPLGDIGDFNWRNEDVAVDSLLKIIKEKEQKEETVGVNLTWEDTGIGGSLLIWNDASISINLSVNRKQLDCANMTQITDVNWYLAKILPVFNQDGICIASYVYQEHA